MLPALRLRVRSSCLQGHRLEPHGLRQQCRQITHSHGQNKNKNARGQKSAKQVKEEQANHIALLDELFPGETKRRFEPPEPEEEVPRLQLDIPDFVTTPGPRRKQSWRDAELPLDDLGNWTSASRVDSKKMYARLERQGEFVSVLVLRNASKNLVEEDFKRVIPQGKHIEGWSLERGDILKVIPGRDTSTLDQENYYYILFKSPVSAYTYQIHVTRLHQIAKSQTPSTLTSPIPPPPGYLVGGEDLHRMIQSYSLLSLAQDMDIRLLSPPLTASMQQIVDLQGYPPIVNRAGKSPFEVLLRLDGPQLPPSLIRNVISRLGRTTRNLPWTSAEEDIRLFKWEPTRFNVSPMGRKHIWQPRTYGMSAEEKEEFLKNLEEEKARSGDEHGEEVEHSQMEEIGEPEETEENQQTRRHDRSKMRKPLPRYIVGFQTEAEAQTFVRYWHRRPLEMANSAYFGGDSAPIVNVQLLW